MSPIGRHPARRAVDRGHRPGGDPCRVTRSMIRASQDLTATRRSFDPLLESRARSVAALTQLVTTLPVFRAHLSDSRGSPTTRRRSTRWPTATGSSCAPPSSSSSTPRGQSIRPRLESRPPPERVAPRPPRDRARRNAAARPGRKRESAVPGGVGAGAIRRGNTRRHGRRLPARRRAGPRAGPDHAGRGQLRHQRPAVRQQPRRQRPRRVVETAGAA